MDKSQDPSVLQPSWGRATLESVLPCEELAFHGLDSYFISDGRRTVSHCKGIACRNVEIIKYTYFRYMYCFLPFAEHFIDGQTLLSLSERMVDKLCPINI